MEHTEAAAGLAQLLRTGPFHLALRAALTARGLPLQRVRHHLAHRGITVGVTSLCYWQQGARRPQRPESLRAVRALEELLGLPRESLIRLLDGAPDGRAGGVRGGAARPAARAHRPPAGAPGVVERLVADLGLPADGGLHTVGHHERVRIGAERELLGRDSLHVVRAHRDGVDRHVAVHRGDPGCAPERVVARAGDNCRVGRVRWHRAAGVVVAELLFDAPLRAGDTYVFGYGFEDGTGGPSTEYVRGFRFAGGQYVLQVGFHEEALPVRCRRFARASAGAPRGTREDLVPSGRHRTVHFVEPGVRPGLLGIGWDWE
ncbi:MULTISPECIES: hypothetical protein [Streptomyces]|uniref:XRE family transcriptional regulator n=1 Tax=Streptomyces sudanensis TaxID=436397 RepID=A0ABY4TAF8_9ACTN|nr:MULTISPECIES: hypothetical protein [Streptomyces]MCP9988478.1 hypothetical protein [Streptomyces sudanensis]URN15697.1 hypothetical protein MW084_06680 [Streptomyces sudanensis]